jgi:hypothetical protein
MRGPGVGFVHIDEMEKAVRKASRHPDGYFEAIVEDKSERLRKWSEACAGVSFSAAMLAPSGCAIRAMQGDGNGNSGPRQATTPIK